MEKLIGALIGLARATDGAARLPESLFPVIFAGLHAAKTGEDCGAMLERVHREKFTLVPDCALCQSPCGRTSDYDTTQLAALSPALQEAKGALLEHLKRIGSYHHQNDAPPPGMQDFLLRALFILGEDYVELEDVAPLLAEAKTYLL